MKHQGSGRRTGRVLVVAAFVLLWIPCLAVRSSSKGRSRAGKRDTLIRDIPVLKDQLEGRCNNTVQGRWLVADSDGFVCERQDLAPDTLCCNGGAQYSCDTCNLGNKCCEDYERCVSCCMDPQYKASELMLQQFRAAGREETGHWGTPFEFCKGKCRSSSRSTVHENAYLSPLHHCFSTSGKPTVPSPPVPDVPPYLTVLASKDKQSCTERCEEALLSCSERDFPVLNDCNRMRETFACEAGCEAGAGLALPAYIIPRAAKSERPAMCLTWSADLSKEAMRCDLADSNRQRACPCGPRRPLL